MNWARVAGENDGVHEHWVEGIGVDAILDFSTEEGDKIKIVGHTAAIRSIEQGEDDFGNFTKIVIRSNQNGAGAHDDDDLGTLYVYGDPVEQDDIEIDAAPTYGMERLNEANRLAEDNGGARRTVVSATDGDTFSGGGRVHDIITLGEGSQRMDGQAGNDRSWFTATPANQIPHKQTARRDASTTRLIQKTLGMCSVEDWVEIDSSFARC